MPKFCHKCGAALAEPGAFCSVCGTPVEPGVAPTLDADGRLRFRLGLAAAFLGVLLIGIVVMSVNRSSPPDKRPAVISPISKTEVKPSAALPKDSAAEEPEPASSDPAPATHDQVSIAPTQPSSTAGKTKGRTDSARTPSSARIMPQPTNGPSQLQFAEGDCLFVHVVSINRAPDGGFTFRGTLLEPFALAGVGLLDQSTELAGSGRVGSGHTAVLVTGFILWGENYRLRAASGVNKRPGSGPALELAPGKTLEMWFSSASVYTKTS